MALGTMVAQECKLKRIRAVVHDRQEFGMEPITLCGVVILAFGLWVELEPTIMKIAKTILNSAAVTALTSTPKPEKPLYVRYMAGMN